mmetsp:Transcript_8789/g.29676  ORF Transcript_8789/g.29676 Transcript_8789/m.29676 type:complete len:230 (-) Transcript_8789:593-1282(-)
MSPLVKSLKRTVYVSYPVSSMAYANTSCVGDGLNPPSEQYRMSFATALTSSTVSTVLLPRSTRHTMGYAAPFFVRTKYSKSPHANRTSSSVSSIPAMISSYTFVSSAFKCAVCASVYAFSAVKYSNTRGSLRSSSLNQNKSSTRSRAGFIALSPRNSPSTAPNFTTCGLRSHVGGFGARASSAGHRACVVADEDDADDADRILVHVAHRRNPARDVPRRVHANRMLTRG